MCLKPAEKVENAAGRLCTPRGGESVCPTGNPNLVRNCENSEKQRRVGQILLLCGTSGRTEPRISAAERHPSLLFRCRKQQKQQIGPDEVMTTPVTDPLARSVEMF
jgi:hypothetical protein